MRRSAGDVNKLLEIRLYRGQFQLITTDALYSDGDRYLPAVAVVNDIKGSLSSVKKVLVLGTGLGSMVRVLSSKGHKPHFTLVEIDKTVLKWAMELMDPENVKRTDPICSDAKLFMEHNKSKFDLIFIDVFNGRVVPQFVTTPDLLKKYKDGLSNDGRLALNYIINNERDWEKVKRTFGEIFPSHHILDMGINRILITD